ncbi:hypothetical protein PC116_g33029 [Phytophthora cactorum]|nr:hypothetical protein PC116_g33029 [Phytophthora cactorum]
MRMLPRPGRAGGMLHDDIALGAASARAQAAPAGAPAPPQPRSRTAPPLQDLFKSRKFWHHPAGRAACCPTR